MIDLRVSTSDSPRMVTCVVRTDSATVSLYRRVGLSPEQMLVATATVTNGVYTFIDTAPPEKTLLSYAAVNAEYERSDQANTVVPTTWSLTRPTLAGDIRVGELTLNTVDSDGTVWTVSDISGWWTLPESEIPSVARARQEDGSYDEDGRFLARTLTLTGVFLPKSPEYLESARSKLVSAVTAVRRIVPLQVDETPPRQMYVRLTGRTSIDTTRPTGLTEFSVALRAADPIKYGLTPATATVKSGTASGGRTYPRSGARVYGAVGSPNVVMIYNVGTYPTPPTMRIYGPVTNPRIESVSTGQQMEFLITLASGQYLDIDSREKTVLLNGAASRRGVMTFASSFFSLVPGVNSIRFTAQSAPGNESYTTIAAYPAWIG